MEFFCSKCQRKYTVDKIGFDLREICAERAAVSAEELLGSNQEDWEKDIANRRQALGEEIAKWCRSSSNKAFVLVGDDLLRQIEAEKTHAKSKVISGPFMLSLKWLLEAYEEDGMDVDYSLIDIDEQYEPVYDGYLKVTYEITGNQRMLTRIQDEDGDPFTGEDGVKRGFRRCCPEGHPLSPVVGKAKEHVIALAGSPRAGKSSCLIAITRALRDGLYDGMSLDSQYEDPQWDKIAKEIDDYRRGWAVTKTDLTDKDLNYSILVTVGKSQRVLTFVDIPGELWQADGTGFSKAWYTDYSGTYENLDCIWFFVSKWTAYGPSATLTDDQQRRMENLTAETVKQVQDGDAANLKANLRNLRDQLNAEGKSIPPVAVILTKGDVPITMDDWEDAKEYGLFPVSNRSLASPSEMADHNVKELNKLFIGKGRGPTILNEHEYWLYSNKVRKFFQKVNNGALCRAVEENCEQRSYISMAAYGHLAPKKPSEDTQQPIAQALPLPPTPYHEMFPLLWTFAILGALPVRHRCEWYTNGLLNRSRLNAEEDLDVVLSNAQQNQLNEQDAALCARDIRNNLLTITDRDEKNSYTITKFQHRRR